MKAGDSMLNYDNFNEGMKLFLNKAMDIYSAIKFKKITKCLVLFQKKYYSILENDEKKILSLFLAGFLVDGELKNVLSDYKDLKVKDVLSFLEIKESDIKSLPESDYPAFYKQQIFGELYVLLKDMEVQEITPKLVFHAFHTNEIQILNNFAREAKISLDFLNSHPFFKQIEALVVSDNFYYQRMKSIASKREELQNQKTQLLLESASRIQRVDDSIWSVLEDIKGKFIGQEELVENLFYNIINNQRMAQMTEVPDGQRSIIFIDGPTGTGKTAITREITQKLGIPFTAASVINYSSTGYVGGDITDTLYDLYAKANGNLESAQRGIIVLDEFDKIAYSKDGGLEMKKAVQQQLLDFLGGGTYRLEIKESSLSRKSVEFSTSNITFICLAALSDLRGSKIKPKPLLGFNVGEDAKQVKEYKITPEDLINIGLERELVGRFNTYLYANEYSLEDLVRILKESSISPLLGFEKWLKANGKKLEIEEGIYELIAKKAYELNTGARSLQTVMNGIRTPLIKEVIRGTTDTIHLNSDLVNGICENVTTRKRKL